jgi:hypothetical protein
MTLDAVGSYTDNSTKDVTSQVTWEIVPRDAVKIKANTLTALKDTSVTIQARLGTVTSEPIKLSIYWGVNGHRLPPEPDKAVNDSTLLGIDVNNNGVRDDVERYIYQRFSKDLKYPKTKIAIGMQWAKATQHIIKSPTLESDKYMAKASGCERYWLNSVHEKTNKKIMQLSESDFDEAFKLDKEIDIWENKNRIFNVDLEDVIFNTKERIQQRFKFNEACSGNIFELHYKLDDCEKNIDELGE